MKPTRRPGFTLIEVIVAVGIVATTVVAVVGLLAAGSKAVADLSARNQAVRLGDAVRLELERLRDLPPTDGTADALELLAARIPAGGSSHSLRLVASRDGLRVVSESDADDPVIGVPRRERCYRIEVRQQTGQLGFRPGAGYLAVAATVRWPDLDSPGTGGPGETLNIAVTP